MCENCKGIITFKELNEAFNALTLKYKLKENYIDKVDIEFNKEENAAMLIFTGNFTIPFPKLHRVITNFPVNDITPIDFNPIENDDNK